MNFERFDSTVIEAKLEKDLTEIFENIKLVIGV
jgi:hypothetical protein